ncbi:uncharacterized protein LOC62_06G008559 [Vanrija pseudolonga]|uniref:Uncharacterized protein n=1 Tax=Vanrija pseudolonga TaxID=143232 RepID=A0AAF0YJB8_9TREE|nr:hypothetical protein LOC62_06G008559 [Vanrija pseudolonga]
MATATTGSPWWRKLLCMSDDAAPPTGSSTKQLYSRTQASRKNLGHIDEASSTTPLRSPVTTKPPGQRTVSFSQPPPPRIDTTTDDSAALLMGFSTEEPEGGWAAARGWTPTSPKTPTVKGKTEAQLLAEEAKARAAEARAEREKAAEAEAEAAKAADGEGATEGEKETEHDDDDDKETTPVAAATTTDPGETSKPAHYAAADHHEEHDAESDPELDETPHAPDVSITAPTHEADAPASADHSFRIDFTASPALQHDERLSDAGADAAEVLAVVEGAGVALGAHPGAGGAAV